MSTMLEREQVEAPVLEEIECMCGSTMLDGKCLNIECETAAKQSLPSGSVHGSTIVAPSAFTIRGSVD